MLRRKTMTTANKLRVLMIGAHPDDTDGVSGGTAALYTRQGHTVKMVSVTNGAEGHYQGTGSALVERRRKEAAAAGAALGLEYITLDNPDSNLEFTLDLRNQMIKLIREFGPDVIMTHRPNDYHPDHRVTSQAVQDSIIATVYVPSIVPEVPPLTKTPAMFYMWDQFTKPYVFSPDVVISIDDTAEQKIDALDCHVSQMYEAGPHFWGVEAPPDPTERRAWLRERFELRLRHLADLYRDQLIEFYGEEKGRQIKYAEAFEACEYGRLPMHIGPTLTDEKRKQYFPFFD
jgi:LmbE family N-acetylglucosaminyl deacetylase